MQPENLANPVAPPLMAALPTSSAGSCLHCGHPLTSSGPTLWHRRTGTLSYRPVRDPDDGWTEPDGWAKGSCASTARLLPVAS